MKHLRRLGILAAATTFAGTSALAGAGFASAQGNSGIRFDSPSSISVARVGGEVVVSYNNSTEHTLFCGVSIGNRYIIGEMFQWWATLDDPTEVEIEVPDSLVAAQLAAIAAGQFTNASFFVAPGGSGPVTFEGYFPDDLAPDFDDLDAMSQCVQFGGSGSYAELETTTRGGGGEGILSSLEDLIPSLGS